MTEGEFQSAVDDAMLALGWTLSTTEPHEVAPVEGLFVRALGGGMLSLAAISYWEPDEDDRPRGRSAPPATVTGDVAVAYGAAQRLLAIVRRSSSTAAVYEDAGVVLGRGELSYELARDGDLVRVVSSVTGVVDEAARVLAERIATIDQMIAAVRADPDRADLEAEVVPILLAAAGRGSEARAALAAYARLVDDSHYVAFGRRLESFLDSGREIPGPSDVFDTPPRPPRERVTLEDERARDAIRVEALAAVRDLGGDPTPAQRRDALRRELEARGLEESPFHAERRDEAGDASLKARAFAWVRLARAVKDVADVLRGKLGESEVHSRPTNRWYEVLLVDGAERVLEQAFAAPVMRTGGFALVDATLRWAGDDPAPTDVLVRGSTVGRPHSERGRAEAHARVQRQMGDVTVRARLLRKDRAPRYLLELEL
jgi:hypothetical protein